MNETPMKRFREAKEMSQPELARLVGTSVQNISRLERADRKLSKEWAEKIAPYLGVHPSALFFEKTVLEVPLKSYIGAGQAVYPIDDGGEEMVDAPPDAKPETVAAKIVGDSMLPAFEDGWILYYSTPKPPHEMVNMRCVIQVADGRLLVKTLKRGSQDGLWTLTSSNASDIEDVPVDWVAKIDWIKPR